jgi:hypothetical protein
MQADLDVNPARLGEVLAANGVDEPSYRSQAGRLASEMAGDAAKAQRFEQLREYYRAILGSPS